MLAVVGVLSDKPSDDPDEKGSELVAWYTLLWVSPGFVAAVASLAWVFVKRREQPPPGPPNPFAAPSDPPPAGT